MSEPPPIPNPQANMIRLLCGGIVGNLVTVALYFALIFVGTYVPWFTKEPGSLISVPSVLLVPAAGGLAAAWIWRTLRLSIGYTLLHSVWALGIGIAGAAIFLREGVVCLVMASPIIWVALAGGMLLGRIWFKGDRSRLNLLILPTVALMGAGELATRSDEREVVMDELLIHAAPAKVWPHVLAFPEITEPPSYWIFRLGLPYPVATTNGGDWVGADRQCIFSQGAVLKERIAEFVPDQRLTFDIVEQPSDPEAYGHITLHRGRFDLRDNHDGTTTLIGSSWYTLHVRPLFYFDWWTRDMTREVHLRVMRHIRRLAEGPGA